MLAFVPWVQQPGLSLKCVEVYLDIPNTQITFFAHCLRLKATMMGEVQVIWADSKGPHITYLWELAYSTTKDFQLLMWDLFQD